MLLLDHLERYGVEVTDDTSATVVAATAAVASESPRLVPHADLSHFDSRLEDTGEITHEFAEVDASVRREVETDLVAVELPLNIDELHGEVLPPYVLLADVVGFLFFAAQFLQMLLVFARRAPEDRPSGTLVPELRARGPAFAYDLPDVLPPLHLHDRMITDLEWYAARVGVERSSAPLEHYFKGVRCSAQDVTELHVGFLFV